MLNTCQLYIPKQNGRSEKNAWNVKRGIGIVISYLPRNKHEPLCTSDSLDAQSLALKYGLILPLGSSSKWLPSLPMVHVASASLQPLKTETNIENESTLEKLRDQDFEKSIWANLAYECRQYLKILILMHCFESKFGMSDPKKTFEIIALILLNFSSNGPPVVEWSF